MPSLLLKLLLLALVFVRPSPAIKILNLSCLLPPPARCALQIFNFSKKKKPNVRPIVSTESQRVTMRKKRKTFWRQIKP
jgi:hypothetical protein